MYLCLISALLWSTLDFVRKRLVSSLTPLQLAVALATGQALLFALWLLASGNALTCPDRAYFFPATASLLFGATGFYLYLSSVALGALSLTIPLLSITPAVSALAALTLGEWLQPQQCLGLLLVVGGGMLLRQTRGSSEVGADDISRAQLYMFGAAVCWGINTVFDKLALRQLADEGSSVQFHGLFMTSFATLLYASAGVRREGMSEFPKAIWSQLTGPQQRIGWLLLLAILAAEGALATQLMAIQVVPVGVFEGIKRSIGVCLAIAVGHFYFGEVLSRRKLLAGSLLIVGLGLLQRLYAVDYFF